MQYSLTHSCRFVVIATAFALFHCNVVIAVVADCYHLLFVVRATGDMIMELYVAFNHGFMLCFSVVVFYLFVHSTNDFVLWPC